MEIEKSFTNDQLASQEIEKLKSLIPLCQYIYNDFKAKGIPATLKDIATFAARCRKDNQDQLITDELRNLLLTKPENHTLKSATPTVKAEMVKVPDYRNLKEWVNKNWPAVFDNTRFSTDHMVIKADKIELLYSLDAVRKKHTQVFKFIDHEAIKKANNNGEAIVIQHDEHHIAKAVKNADDMIKDGQHVYDMFAAIGVSVSVNEIHDLLHGDLTKKPSDHIQTMVTNKLVDKAGDVTLNGLPVKREKVKDMIEVPDTKHIVTRLGQIGKDWMNNVNDAKKFVKSHVQIKDGKVIHADGFHDDLNSKHKHVTMTPRGAEIAAKLAEVSKYVIELSELFGKDDKGHYYYPASDFVIPGLKNVVRTLPEIHVWNNKRMTTEFVGHRIDLDFIRNQERIAEGK